MSNDKMRAEFEIAAKTAQGLDVTRLPHGGYRSFATHQAWWAWQASRAAMVIELPDKISQYNTDDAGFVDPAAAEHDEAIDDCRAVIEAAGVRVHEGEVMAESTQGVIQDKHWKHTLYGGTIESHTEFLLSGYKRAYGMYPSKKALMNHIKRLVEETQRTKNND